MPVSCTSNLAVALIYDVNILIHFLADTTRPMRAGEVAGREYLFVTREKMEADIAASKFIEHGEYKGHLYGTAADSVKSIVNASCVCVLGPHYQALKSLRTAQLKPYIVHIRPPAFEELKKSRTKARARSTFDENNSRGFTVSSYNYNANERMGTWPIYRNVVVFYRTKNLWKWSNRMSASIFITATSVTRRSWTMIFLRRSKSW